MNKLTAEEARFDLGNLKKWQSEPHGISMKEERYMQALEIALPILEQQGDKRQVTLNEALAEQRKLIEESGGYNFAALRAEQDGRADKCIWRYDENDYYWSGACGEDWCFTDGGPEENRVRFCQGCGRPVMLEQQDQPTNQNGEQ